MKIDFSLTYDPKKEYNEIGYHTTLIINKDDIIINGFKPSKNKDDWLGEGVYFWDNETNAYWWKQNTKSINKCVFVCKLKCQLLNYLNLDDKVHMQKFEVFIKKYLQELSIHSNKKPNFLNNSERRKFFCDVYCTNNNINILSFTFKHDIVNKLGFTVGNCERKQICVREQKCISILNVKELCYVF